MQTTYNEPGYNGKDSLFGHYIAIGGGGGGAFKNEPHSNVYNGGSGGGGGTISTGKDIMIQGMGTSGQGNDGGIGSSSNANSGGGGGSGSIGKDGTSTNGGDGGDGTIINITGQDIYYACGGGGGSIASNNPGSGMVGGGNGGGVDSNGGNALDNRGSGGGGSGSLGIGGSGGSGIVIIRCKLVTSELNIPFLTSGVSMDVNAFEQTNTLTFGYDENYLRYDYYPELTTFSDTANLIAWYKFDAVPTNGATLTNYGSGGSAYDATLNIASNGIERLDGYNAQYRYHWKSDSAQGNYISVPGNILQSLYEKGHTICFWAYDINASDSDYTVLAGNNNPSTERNYL